MFVVFDFSKTDKTTSGIVAQQPRSEELTEEMIPFSSSGKFLIIPPVQSLYRLSVADLQNIKGFTIISHDGEICFQDSLNVLGLDVDKLVAMDHLTIDILDKDLLADLYGFNKPVKFTICNLPKSKPDSQLKTELMRRLQVIDARMTSWDSDNRRVSFVANSTSLY